MLFEAIHESSHGFFLDRQFGHALEGWPMHDIAAAGTALHGEATTTAREWTQTGRQAVPANGWPGLLDHIGTTPVLAPTTGGQASLDQLIGSFAKHMDRLGYYGRLRTGRSIGSGGVESLARRIGDRLKVAGRGWCTIHLKGMAALVATVDTPEWDGLWLKRVA